MRTLFGKFHGQGPVRNAVKIQENYHLEGVLAWDFE
jgi:hypothetical protein